MNPECSLNSLLGPKHFTFSNANCYVQLNPIVVTVFPLQNTVLIFTSMLTPQNLTENFPWYPNVLVKQTCKLAVIAVSNIFLFRRLSTIVFSHFVTFPDTGLTGFWNMFSSSYNLLPGTGRPTVLLQTPTKFPQGCFRAHSKTLPSHHFCSSHFEERQKTNVELINFWRSLLYVKAEQSSVTLGLM